MKGVSDRYPQITPEYDYLAKYSHVDSLGINHSLSLENGNLVTFSQPIKDKTSVINGIRVNIRKSPSVSSKIVKTLDLGERVKIVDVVQGESIWYKIEWRDITGYIFGAFLEPVEQIMTNK